MGRRKIAGIELESLSNRSWALLVTVALACYNAVTSLSDGVNLAFRSETARNINNFFDFPLIDLHAYVIKPLTFLPDFLLGVANVALGCFCSIVAVTLVAPLRQSLETDRVAFRKEESAKRQQQERETQKRREVEEQRRREQAERARDRAEKARVKNESKSTHTPAGNISPTPGLPKEPVNLGKLQTDFPRRARELRDRQRLLGDLSSDINTVAERVWELATYWLAYLDGDDFGLCNSREVYDLIEVNARQLNVTIEKVAGGLMEETASDLHDFEISLALLACADVVGEGLKLNGNVDDTFKHLVRARDGARPTNAKARNGIADSRLLGIVQFAGPDTYPWWAQGTR